MFVRASSVVLALLPNATLVAQGRPFDLDATGRIVSIGDPRPSPDGRTVVIVLSRPDYEQDRFTSELVAIDVATGQARNLAPARKSVGSARWSPGGDRLAFLAPGDSGSSQIWILPISAGGEAVKLTEVKGGVRQFAWKPDGSAFAFVAEDTLPARVGTERHNRSFEVEWNDYLTTTEPRARHLWLVPATGGAPTRLTGGSWSLTTLNDIDIAWMPDGSRIVFTRQTGPGTGHWYGNTLAAVAVPSGEVKELVSSFGSEPLASPDGQWIAYSAPRGKVPEFSSHGIFVLPRDGGTGKLVSDVDVALWSPLWFDRTTLLLCGTDGTRARLWRKPLDGPSTPVELGLLQPSCGAVAPTVAGGLALVAARDGGLSDLYWVDRLGGTPKQLTHYNDWVNEYTIARSEGFKWQSDNFTADGVLTYPPGFEASRRYPLVLSIHGGPMGVSTTSFDPLAQLLAAKGWLVFQPNYRGSSGQGNAYQSAVIGDAGDGPGRDVMSGLEVIVKRGIVDTARMGVSGWSYGGYMTTWLLGHYPRWKAGLAGAAVTDYADGYYLSDYGPSFGGAWGGSPFKAPYDQIVKAQSPITYASKIKAPVLILATTGDPRVPIVQSYKLYHLLIDYGVPVRFVAYPVHGHFPSDPVHIRDIWRRWVEWFTRQLE
jgi:dipeptidyl aminopeptidase/acylaminoacyl peptidase